MEQKKTSWGKVADWYDSVVEGEGSYQKELILPNLLRLVAPAKGLKVLDLACGQGVFSRAMHEKGAIVEGVDIGSELIDLARKNSSPEITFHVSSADSVPFLKDASFDVVMIVLAIQNIEKYMSVIAESSRVLVQGGRLFIVMNHPAFRIPGKSSWAFDEEKDVQFRRVDGYLSESSVEIKMEPGKDSKEGQKTVSFHRPLQAYVKSLQKSGFAVSRLEEWTSHKKSEKGGRQIAEDRARNEIPLFLMLEAIKIK